MSHYLYEKTMVNNLAKKLIPLYSYEAILFFIQESFVSEHLK